ncbi:MAG TPA: hypothetical protein VEA69_08910 [Tepidisphaeraceae bacterium]|nr:hypothetical protein [Tepidisphaeraceae bacterium]
MSFRCLLLLLLLAPLARADIASLKPDPAGHLLINDKPAKLWGLRVASAATSDAATKQLLETLPTLKEDGVNLLLVCYQGGTGLTTKTFAADGASFEDTAVRDRVRQIIAAADKLDVCVAVSLFFPRKMGIGGQDPKLASRDAYLAACRTAAEELKDKRNVLVIVADQPSAGAFAMTPMKFMPADVIDCLKAVAAVAPGLPRGGGGSLHAANQMIAQSEAATIIVHAETGVAPPAFASVKKPILHAAYTGPIETAGKNPQGFYPPPARQPYTDMLDKYLDAPTAHVVAHFPAWTEGGQDLKPNRFDVGGPGTQKEPGLAWYLDALRQRTRKPDPAKPAGPGDAPGKPGKSIFD